MLCCARFLKTGKSHISANEKKSRDLKYFVFFSPKISPQCTFLSLIKQFKIILKFFYFIFIQGEIKNIIKFSEIDAKPHKFSKELKSKNSQIEDKEEKRRQFKMFRRMNTRKRKIRTNNFEMKWKAKQ